MKVLLFGIAIFSDECQDIFYTLKEKNLTPKGFLLVQLTKQFSSCPKNSFLGTRFFFLQ